MKTQIVAPPGGLEEALSLLAAGEVVALPTETVYGLAADALKPLACAKIFEAKDRPLSDPLIVHLPDLGWLDRVAKCPALAHDLAARFWPGPLTMVVPRTPLVPDIVTDGQDTVAVRMSSHPVFRDIVTRLGKPLAAPSANRFGRISPTTPEHVRGELEGRIPLIIDGGPCEHGIESTIVFVHDDGVEILRHGPITLETLTAAGFPIVGGARVVTPGSMKSHYAPRTRLVFRDAESPTGPAVGLLAWSDQSEGFGRVEYLSRDHDLRQAAANLYGAMRRLDEAGLDCLVADPLPESGLGSAIMERLRKAAV